MRTTIDIPDPIYRRLKAAAAMKGDSVRHLILQAVQSELHDEGRKRQGRVRLPIVRSNKPGKVALDNASIYQIIPFP